MGIRDFDLIKSMEGWYGATLTFLNKEDSLKWEPGAALPNERIAILKQAYKIGISTWVSLEPVIDPEQTLEIIRQTYEFVDLYKVGKLNYHPLAKMIDWHKFVVDVIRVLKEKKKHYDIKKDLLHYLYGRRKSEEYIWMSQ